MSLNEEEVGKMSFEDAITKLEELVKKLEEGNLDLDKSIDIYNEAILLRKRCRTILDSNERKVQKLMESADGVVKEDFSP